MLLRLSVVLYVVCALARAQGDDDDDAPDESDPWRPRYHFIPRPFGWMNDPNGLFYDPVFQRYHLMYQYLTPRVWGHAVSTDLVHWEQLPIALENNEWYNSGGVFSGSATVLDDDAMTPMLSYAVSTNNMQCLAFPTNRSDPNLVQWTNYAGNPVISSSTGAPEGRDPTTAWLNEEETHWLMAYGIVNEAIIYSTPVGNYSNWTQVGPILTANTGQWECPDFYYLPNPNDTVDVVVKASTEGRDYWVVGSYDPTTMTMTPTTNTTMGMSNQLYDYGVYYASKRFFDPKTNRQILFGWVVDMGGSGHDDAYSTTWASTQSLPRSVTLDDDGVSLKIEPVTELQSLRVETSTTHRNILLNNNNNNSYLLTGIEGKQLEIIATFAYNSSNECNCGVDVFVDTVAQQEATRVGFQQLGAYMQGMDLPGNDYNITPETYTDPRDCERACDDDPHCVAWTFVIPGGPPGNERCCLKNPVPSPVPDPFCVSGVKGQSAATVVYSLATNSSLNSTIQKNNYAGNLQGVQGEITLHIFVDHSVVEVYANAGHGSVVITQRVYPTLSTSVGVAAFSIGASPCNLLFFEAWELDSV